MMSNVDMYLNFGTPRDASPGPAQAPGDETATQLAYHEMLTRLCVLAEVPLADHDTVVAREALILGEVTVALQLEEWSSFVKVFIDVGKPTAAAAPDLHRYLLSQQLYLPAPFSLVTAIHPDTDSVVLYGYSPLPTDRQGDESFFAFLHGCVYACEVLRANSPQPLEA